MCYLVRDEFASPEPDRTTKPARDGSGRRWVAGAAVAALGGLAVAAWIDSPRVPEAAVAQEIQRPAAVASRVDATPASVGAGEGVKLVDDEVPTAAGKVRGAAGHCEHGM